MIIDTNRKTENSDTDKFDSMTKPYLNLYETAKV